MVKKKRVRPYHRHADLQRYYRAKKRLDRLFFMYLAVIGLIVLFVGIRLTDTNTIDQTFVLPDYLYFSPGLASAVSNGNANVTIYDSTDLGENRYSDLPVTFYANYTDVLGVPITDSEGTCEIVGYDLTVAGGPLIAGPDAMAFVDGVWEVDRIVPYKGEHTFIANCSSSLYGEDLVVGNDFLILNKVPDLNVTASATVDFDNNFLTTDVLGCTEDALCLFNFSEITHDPDINDFLRFSHISENTTLTNFTLNASTGLLEILVTHDDYTGDKQLDTHVRDNEQPIAGTDRGVLKVNITAVNDAPVFLNLANQSFNRSELFEYNILINDEENNIPLSLNISFVSCTLAPWSQKTDCELFDESDYTFNPTSYDDGESILQGGMISLSFVPGRDDVGVYEISFNVTDSGTPNASRVEYVNLTVVNLNEEPWFRYVCDDVRETSEDIQTTCYINASDNDELNNLTFVTNQPWFLNETSIPTGFSTQFNASVMVDFTPGDAQVGNWTINVSVYDTGRPNLWNSTIINFSVLNVDDAVQLHNFTEAFVAFTSNNYTIYVNATDDDLLIPDASVYDEQLTFTVDASWIQIISTQEIPGTNRTVVALRFNPNDSPGASLHMVSLNVSDANGFSSDRVLLPIQVEGNFAPRWDPATITYYELTEDTPVSINFSEDVIDGDDDSLAYTTEGLSGFDSFNLDTDTGVVDFTPGDADVGLHRFNISVSDGITPAVLEFTFNVSNVPDGSAIVFPPNLDNATLGPNDLVQVFEDDSALISFLVEDDDVLIDLLQTDYYREDFVIGLGINGPNPSLFSFIRDTNYPRPSFENVFLYSASLTPNKSDVGNYTIEFNVTDASGNFNVTFFNLTVFEVDHDPVIDNLTDQGTIPDLELVYDINATDLEDGDDSGGLLTYSYVFLNGTDFILGDETIFNTTSGLLNFTPTDSQVGTYRINITVTDSVGRTDSDDFYLTVYTLPEILFPPPGTVFNMQEGVAHSQAFSVNASASTDLIYSFSIRNELRTIWLAPGDGTLFLQDIVPAYTDETYGLLTNATLLVTIPSFPALNASRTWEANITHSNAPIDFFNDIPNKEGGYGSPVFVDLKEHFSDPDYFDTHYNQTVVIDIVPNLSTGVTSSIAYSVDENWVVSFTASGTTRETFNITLTDYDSSDNALTTNTSNYFVISFVDPILVPTPVPTPSSGGGGGGSGSSPQKPKVLKLLTPGEVKIDDSNRVLVPITIENQGSVTFQSISLNATLLVDGEPYPDAFVQFETDFYSAMSPGQSQETLLTAYLNGVPPGYYELLIEGTVGEPFVQDSARVVITTQERDSFTERIIFTEDLIVSNPECLELQELLDEAKLLFDNGSTAAAEAKLNEVIEGCRDAISQRSLFSRNRLQSTLEDKVFRYLFFATIVAVILGVVYYVYRRITFIKILRNQQLPEDIDSLDYTS